MLMATDTSIKWKSSSQSDISNKVANSLIVKLNGTNTAVFDGSAAKSVNITPASIGAALTNHSHSQYANVNHNHDKYLRYRGVCANDHAIDNAFTSGYYYLNGGQYHILNYNIGYGWLTVYADDKGGTEAITQILQSDKYIFTRLYSGDPGSWGSWYRSGAPIIYTDTEYGDHTLQTNESFTSEAITIDWEGWYLLYECAYSNWYDVSGCESGILQVSAVINNSNWVIDSQSLNEYVAAPSASGVMMYHFIPGDKVQYRVYYQASHRKEINIGYTYFKLFRLT